MISKPDALIFDMDGTLWDAVDTYVWIWNEAFRQLNIERTFTREEMVGMMGKQFDEIINQCMPEEMAADVKRVYDKVYSLQQVSMPLLGGKLYDGVKEGIASLSEKYRIFILSNCESYGIAQFLEYAGLKEYITDHISFGDTRMPKAINMQFLKARHGLSNPVYIGDTESDAIQSRNAAVPFVLVTYGFGKCDNPVVEFDNFKSLTAYFETL